MTDVTLDHFKRAAADIGAHGDNDTLPFDIDVRFVKESGEELAEAAFRYSQEMAVASEQGAKNAINGLSVFSERLLTPTGSAGFRITTKIHPFWNLYFNGLGVAIAKTHEPLRSDRAHSYRFIEGEENLFDRNSSWRSFREASISDCEASSDSAIVVQTDISSFYEHAYHHRIESCVAELFPANSTVAAQIDRFLSKFASGRSFGLPVGGQCSRILAELLMSQVDRTLTDEGIIWRRYVDDFFLITENQAEAYRALSVLSHALADYGLSLNRTKTTMLTSRHYVDYVHSQLGDTDDKSAKLREIDLHFDPYSDNAESDYDELKETVESLEVRVLLELELQKGQPDAFTVAQIGRTLRLHSPDIALQLCGTLLAKNNLHAFRASWSTIMRGISAVRGDVAFSEIHDGIDVLLDAIPDSSPHLLLAEASGLHYLRTLRFARTNDRAKFVLSLYNSSKSETIKRACVDCWRQWKDRSRFISLRNRWNQMAAEEQRMLWLSAYEYGDDGESFHAQVRRSLADSWRLGIERKNATTFAAIFQSWCENA